VSQRGELRDWCPGCEPDVDPLRELVFENHCWRHKPSERGSADKQVERIMGTDTLDRVSVVPETQRAWADFLRSRKEKK